MQHWVSSGQMNPLCETLAMSTLSLNRDDLPKAIDALAHVGFIYRHAAGVSMFLDGPEAKARDGVHVVFAGEKVREEYPEPVPDITDFELMEDAKTLPFEALVRMKLTSFRPQKYQVHIQDMISVRLVDESWLERLSPKLGSRLKELLDDPEG